MKGKDPKYKYQRVMLIDDSELDNYINSKIMEANNFSEQIYINTSGKSAIEFLNNIATSSDVLTPIYPEIFFVDLNMPIMDGFQFIEYLNNMSPVILKIYKIIILTSSVHEEDRVKAKNISNEIIFLNKPLTSTMLAEI